MNPKQRAERALRHAPIIPIAKEAVQTFIEIEIIEAEREAIKDFAKRVEARAEENEEGYHAAMLNELMKLAHVDEL